MIMLLIGGCWHQFFIFLCLLCLFYCLFPPFLCSFSPTGLDSSLSFQLLLNGWLELLGFLVKRLHLAFLLRIDAIQPQLHWCKLKWQAKNNVSSQRFHQRGDIITSWKTFGPQETQLGWLRHLLITWTDIILEWFMEKQQSTAVMAQEANPMKYKHTQTHVKHTTQCCQRDPVQTCFDRQANECWRGDFVWKTGLAQKLLCMKPWNAHMEHLIEWGTASCWIKTVFWRTSRSLKSVLAYTFCCVHFDYRGFIWLASMTACSSPFCQI